jgi:hypothetical protein
MSAMWTCPQLWLLTQWHRQSNPILYLFPLKQIHIHWNRLLKKKRKRGRKPLTRLKTLSLQYLDNLEKVSIPSSNLFWIIKCSWVPLAHTCNPSYLGGWDQKDWSLKPAQGNSLWDPFSKITRAKWTGGMVQVVKHLLHKFKTLSSQVPIPHKKKKKEKKNDVKHYLFLTWKS